MYEFLDRPVTTLDEGGRFLVWSMRSWVKAMGERTCPGTALGAVFGKWDVIAGLQPFLRIMALLNRHGLETFHFCALPCNHVSEHEAIMLGLICNLRRARPETTRDTLMLLVEEEAVGDLLVSLAVLGRAMEKSGISPDGAPWLPHAATRGGSEG